MGFVLYGHWDGGQVGQGLAGALGWCFGEARALAPAALVVGGSALLFAQFMPTRRPLRTGGLCLFAAVTLALAAGTLGVSSGTPAAMRASEQWRSAFLQSHGGILGQGLYWVFPPARADRGRGHPCRVPAGGRRRAADGTLAGGGRARDGQWPGRHQSRAACSSERPRAREQDAAQDERSERAQTGSPRSRGASAAAPGARTGRADRARHACGGAFGRRRGAG